MTAAEPEIPDHIEIPIPGVGPVKVVGRDLLLAITLLIVGAAALVVVVVTMRAMAARQVEALHGMSVKMDAAITQALAGVERGHEERADIVGLLKLQLCQTEYRKNLAPDLHIRWRTYCVGEGIK